MSTDKDQINALRDLLTMYRIAARKFITKVQDGRAKSVETFNDLVRCEEAANEYTKTFEG